MYRMVEAVGISPQGYSEAVRNAVETLIEAGEDVHYFEVLEFRGLVQHRVIKEFQARVRVAIEDGTDKLMPKTQQDA